MRSIIGKSVLCILSSWVTGSIIIFFYYFDANSPDELKLMSLIKQLKELAEISLLFSGYWVPSIIIFFSVGRYGLASWYKYIGFFISFILVSLQALVCVFSYYLDDSSSRGEALIGIELSLVVFLFGGLSLLYSCILARYRDGVYRN